MTDLRTALDQPVTIQRYLVGSTIAAALMFVPLRGTFQIGYVIAIVNTLLLLSQDDLKIHRNHLAALLALSAFSLLGAHLAGTPLNAPVSQIVGISLLSIYFLCALTTFGPTTEQWMELYMRGAFAGTILAFFLWPIQHLNPAESRLRGIYSEPSFYVYLTLPALGYCINRFVQDRRYGKEALIFLASFVLADSSLGYLGILFILIFAFAPKLKGWQIVLGGLLACLLVAGLYAASANLRVRANEMALAIARQNLSGTGASSFAILSNVYVTSQSFLAHPFTGIGIGGYASAYDKFIGDITGTDVKTDVLNPALEQIQSLELNRDDASSMFLRVAAELGIPGLIVLIGFLLVCAMVRGPRYTLIRNAILPYFLIRMGRMGHYFTVELYFFVGLYLLNYLDYRASRKSQGGSRDRHLLTGAV